MKYRNNKCGWSGIFLVRILAGIFVLGAISDAAQDPTPTPARVVTEYALTSGFSWEQPDPANWRLQASNNRGESWETLDVQTNQAFTARSQRRVFRIKNRTAFSLYRLRVEKVQTVQLAELEHRR